MLEVIFFVLLGSVWCLHFVLRYYSTVRDLHCSRSKMEWKSLLSRVWRPVSIATPSPKVRSGPAVILEPAGASQRRAETLEAPKIDFEWKLQCILVEIRDHRQPSEWLSVTQLIANFEKNKTIFLVWKFFQLFILPTGKPSVQSETNRCSHFGLTAFWRP